LFCMKHNQIQTRLKIPKFILFEIIKVVDRKSFQNLDIPDSKYITKEKKGNDEQIIFFNCAIV
jgi:hypothetical protein